MLKHLRKKKTAKKIWIVLAVIIVPAFVLWGFGSAFRSRGEKVYAGKIFGRNIPLLDFKDSMEAVKNQAIMQFGEKFSQVQKYLDLENRAWERLILLSEAQKRKINVSDQEIVDLIQGYPFFQRKGQFDNRIYNEMLKYVFRTQPRAFEEQTRQNIILSKLYKQVTSGVKLSDEDIKKEYYKANQELSIYYLASLPSEFQKDISPSAEEVKDYFAKNSFEFKEPLSFNIEYISLVSEDKVKATLPRLNKRVDLTKLARDLGTEAKETGIFRQTDPIPGIGWAPEVMNLISKLKVGQFSPPVQTDKNYYILRLKERKEPYIPDFETIKDKVRAEFIKNKSSQLAKERIASCLKKLKEAYALSPKTADFNTYAREFGLKAGSTKEFKFGSYIEGIGASDNFWLAAEGLKENEFSSIIETSSGFYIIKVKAKAPIDYKNFETKKEEFTQQLLLQKQQEYFSNFVQELIKKAQLY
jgi:parvulin-like peptidyl-prolyl isomerase